MKPSHDMDTAALWSVQSGAEDEGALPRGLARAFGAELSMRRR